MGCDPCFQACKVGCTLAWRDQALPPAFLPSPTGLLCRRVEASVPFAVVGYMHATAAFLVHDSLACSLLVFSLVGVTYRVVHRQGI